MPLLILVVDDDPDIRLSVTDYLEMSGYSAIAAQNGKEALEMLEEYRPHLIVTDVTMPQMDGYALIRQVRQRPTYRLLPVVLLTARSDPQERIRSYQLGGDIHLAKPFDLSELGAVIRNLLERAQLIQSEWLHQAPAEAPALITQVTLTQREQQVLELLVNGLSNPQIGDRLHLSPRTIEKHISSLLYKTQTNNRVELARFAIEHYLPRRNSKR